ncbi:MAG TPA: DUF6600 domain-containing protein [Chthoniobacterales bacterium]|jgi:hypothetical protein
MKRILIALALIACLSPFVSKSRADAEVSLDFFYDNLSPYGSWIDVDDYGYCFQPNVAVNNSDWRPYSDGYWAYTDVGWTWVSYEDFGWATYHYGRWADLESYGWVWVPGYEWGPAWVSWRTGGDYIGWAPLPPQGETVYEGRPISGAVDVTFDIGPLYYNFVDIRYIGEPVLRQRIIPAQRNVTIINRTVNVTNITYNNSVVYNYGPSFSRLNQYSERPVPRLVLKRESNMAGQSVMTHGGNLNRVSNGQLMVVAPPVQKSQQKIAPKQVKATVTRPQVEHGWKGINNRQQLQAEMKKENPKNVPPPSFTPPANYNGVMTSNGKEGWKQGGMPAPRPPQSTPPTAVTHETSAQNNSERTREENAAAAHRPAPETGRPGDLQRRPGVQQTEATTPHPARAPEIAQPARPPKRPTPFAQPRRPAPIEPSQPSDLERTQNQPGPRPRRPQPAPAENQPQHHEQTEHPNADGASPANGEHQGKPKKKRPNAEQTPNP